MTLFEKISQDIPVAMKAKDKVRLMALRNIKKLFIEAQTAPGANDELSDADALKIENQPLSYHPNDNPPYLSSAPGLFHSAVILL